MTLLDTIRRTLSQVPVLMGGSVAVHRLTSSPTAAVLTFDPPYSVTGRLADVGYEETADEYGNTVRRDRATLRLPYQDAAGAVLTILRKGDRVEADGCTWVVVGRIGAAASSVTPYLVERETRRVLNPREGAA